jgi:hypothetical protein
MTIRITPGTRSEHDRENTFYDERNSRYTRQKHSRSWNQPGMLASATTSAHAPVTHVTLAAAQLGAACQPHLLAPAPGEPSAVRRPPVRWLVMHYREKQRRMLRLRRHPDLSRAIPRGFSVYSAVRKMINEVARGFTAGAHKLDSGAVTVAVRQVPEQAYPAGMTREQPRDPSQGHDCHPLPRTDYNCPLPSGCHGSWHVPIC